MASWAEILRRKKMQDANARVQRWASIMGSVLRATPCREPRAARRRCCLATRHLLAADARRRRHGSQVRGGRPRTQCARYATRLLQRIHYNLSLDQSRGVVLGCRIGAASLREGPFFQTVSLQPSGEGIISFDAARFVIKPVLLVALLGELLFDCPWPGPYRRIFDGHRVFERPWSRACPALD
jgi:hypothetical protein